MFTRGIQKPNSHEIPVLEEMLRLSQQVFLLSRLAISRQYQNINIQIFSYQTDGGPCSIFTCVWGNHSATVSAATSAPGQRNMDKDISCPHSYLLFTLLWSKMYTISKLSANQARMFTAFLLSDVETTRSTTQLQNEVTEKQEQERLKC